MTFISYAQNYEDVMLRRALKDVDKGFYVDVGANDPVIDSVTKAFYDAGWRGINIEPVGEWYERIEQDRPEDINLQLAVGARKGKLDFFEVVGTGLSTMDESIAKRHAKGGRFEVKSYKIPVVRLTTICEKYWHGDIHFLKIDVEGAELLVLQGLDLKKIRPWIILVESTLPNTQIENYEECEHYLTERGYHHVYFDGLNRYYVADEHGELDGAFTAPPNFFDLFKRAREDWLERHSQQLQSEWDAAKTRLEELIGELASIRSHAEHLNAELGEKRKALSENKAALEKERAHNEWLQSEWDAAKTRLEELIGELASIRGHAEHLNAELGEKRKALSESEAALEKERAHNEWLQSEWDAAKTKIDELNHSSHHWWTVAEDLSHELKSVYNSKSWRITWPLRKLMQLFRWLFALPMRVTLWFARLPKRSARWLVVKAMAFALNRPGLKVWAEARLFKYPNFKARLKRLAGASDLLATQPASPTTPTQPAPKSHEPVPAVAGNETPTPEVDLSHLTPGARRIYVELKAAMVQRQKEID